MVVSLSRMIPSKRILRTFITVLFDIISIILAFFAAYYLRAHWGIFDQNVPTPISPYINLLPIVVIVSLFSMQFCHVYRKAGGSLIDIIPNLFIGSSLSTGLLIFITYAFKMYPYSRIVLFLFWVLNFLILLWWRIKVSWVTKKVRQKGIGLIKTIIIGVDESAQLLSRELSQSVRNGYQLAGFLTTELPSVQTSIQDYPILGTLDKLPSILDEQRIEEVFISSTHIPPEKMTEIILLCREKRIRLSFIPEIQEILAIRGHLSDISGIPVIVVEDELLYFWNRVLKRLLDIILALVIVVISFPITFIIAVWIKLDPKSPGSIFFKQTRIGRKGKKFEMYKFRSMGVGAEKELEQLAELNTAKGPMFKIPNDPRITTPGKIIRRWSLDELPQLINVLKNEMSIVGPRPPLPEEVTQYEEWQKRRLEIQPGMTGLWQVSGRSELTFDEMVKLDLYYIEHWSLWLDILILIRTLVAVIQGKGAY